MPSSDAIDAALVGKLSGDATLTTLAPGGVYRDLAPLGVPGLFVIVQQMTHEDQYMLGRAEGFESLVYLVKAVAESTSSSTAQTAANRIHALLQNGSLTITGYTLTLLQREERIAYVEVDEQDRERRYQHRGGLYRLIAEPTA